MPKTKILVVDDARFARHTVCVHLRSAGYETAEASDGLEAVKLLRSPQGAEFSAVLCDILMPNLDGVGVLEQLRAHNIKVPCLMLTADIQTATRKRCEELGCFAFVNKPPDPAVVLPLLAKAVKSSEDESRAAG